MLLISDLGIMLRLDMKSVEQCMYTANWANRALGMIKRTIRNIELEIMVKLYKAIVRQYIRVLRKCLELALLQG